MSGPDFQPGAELVSSLIDHTGGRPDLAVILGSGLGDACTCAKLLAEIPYPEIPGFPQPSVTGHSGRLYIGLINGWKVWFFCGRVHLYEGYSAAAVTSSIRLAAAAGVSRLLVTNASGAIRSEWRPGNFMWIEDHLNFTGVNPLCGEMHDPFVDMTQAYRNDLYAGLCRRLENIGPQLYRGVLACLPGPSYETPAEIRALRVLGADAVSMSTIPEVIMARYHQMQVVGLSFLANAAAGVSTGMLYHRDVLEMASSAAMQLEQVIRELVTLWKSQDVAILA